MQGSCLLHKLTVPDDTHRLQQWINKDILQNAVKNGVDSVREPDHNWQDTSLPPALEQVQVSLCDCENRPSFFSFTRCSSQRVFLLCAFK